MKRFALFVALPFAIAFATYICGTSLPMIGNEVTHHEVRNIVWESIYGIGFSGAAWFCYLFNFEFALSRPVGLVGGLLWPLLVMAVVFIASRRILRKSARTRLVWGAAFLLSLFVCVVGRNAANYLADRCYLPLYFNYEANNY